MLSKTFKFVDVSHTGGHASIMHELDITMLKRLDGQKDKKIRQRKHSIYKVEVKEKSYVTGTIM